MRLILSEGPEDFRLVERHGDNIPSYAILSHTWGADTEEVTFKDLVDGTGKDKVGYGKIEFCRKQAARDGLQFFWVDTCCIDNSNSTELFGAINSMFRWYQKASNCYVYLSDVSTSEHAADAPPSTATWEVTFREADGLSEVGRYKNFLAPHRSTFSHERVTY